MSVKNIGIITSGGDCGGLNGVIRGAALTAISNGVKPYIIPNGYAGLYNLVEIGALTELTATRTEKIQVYMAGSEAGNSRVKIKSIKDDNKYDRIKQGLKKFNLDALVIAGGDDTGSVVVDLAEQGIPCVHAPKTMDLDLMPYSVGGDSTINRIAEFLRDLRTTGQTHNRILVVEVFGRYAGHTAFRGGIAAQADAILIPEIPVDFDILYENLKKIYFRRLDESDVRAATAMVVVAEGLKDASGQDLVDMSTPPDSFGHRQLMGAGKYVVQELSSRIKKDPEVKDLLKKYGIYVAGANEAPEVREVRPGHLVRCGFTTPIDANFGLEIGAAAVKMILKGIFGKTVVSYQAGTIQYMDVADAIVQRHVDVSDVFLFEQMGITFGREPVKSNPAFEKVSGRPVRPY